MKRNTAIEENRKYAWRHGFAFGGLVGLVIGLILGLTIPASAQTPVAKFRPGPGDCTPHTGMFTLQVADYWAFDDPYLAQHATLTAYVLVEADTVYCGQTKTMPVGGAFLLHVYGDDPSTKDEIEGAVAGQQVFIRYQHLLGCRTVRTTRPLIWRDRSSTPVQLIYPGDFDGDGDLDVADMVQLISVAFRGGAGDPGKFDLDGDCKVGITDVALFADVALRGNGNSFQRLTYGCE